MSDAFTDAAKQTKRALEQIRNKPMTPARQPQRKYIITEEQVEYIEPEFPITAMRIRSRPHTSAPAPEPDVTMAVLKRIGEQPEFKESWEKMLNAERNYLCGDIYNIIYSCQYTSPAKMGEISKICKLCNYETDCKEHDAQIAKAEREHCHRVCNERIGNVRVSIMDNRKNMSQDCYESIMNNIDNVTYRIQSLRTQQEPQQ